MSSCTREGLAAEDAEATGFFDHANEWDRFRLTDGKEMLTWLKWPNTITLLEAFHQFLEVAHGRQCH